MAGVLKEWTSNPEPLKPNSRWDFWSGLNGVVLSLHPAKLETPAGAVVLGLFPKEMIPQLRNHQSQSQASSQPGAEMGDSAFLLPGPFDAQAGGLHWLRISSGLGCWTCAHIPEFSACTRMKKEAPCEESAVLSLLFSPSPRHHVAVDGYTDIALQWLPAPAHNQLSHTASQQGHVTPSPCVNWAILALFAVHRH